MANEGGNLNRLASALALTLVLTIAPFLYGGSATSETKGIANDEAPVLAALHHQRSGPVEQVLQALCEAVFGHGDENGGEPPENCTTQYDGRSHGDAADHCDSAAKILPVDDTSSTPFTGLLVPNEDERDHYLVRESARDRDIDVTLTAQPGLQTEGLLDATGLHVLPRFTITVYIKAHDYGCAEAIAFGEQQDGHVHVMFHAEPETQYVIKVERIAGGPGASGTDRSENGPHSMLVAETTQGADSCHGACVAVLNDSLGYRLDADGQ